MGKGSLCQSLALGKLLTPYKRTNHTVHIQAWWCTPVHPSLQRLRQEDQEFMAILGYIPNLRSCLKKTSERKKKQYRQHDGLGWNL